MGAQSGEDSRDGSDLADVRSVEDLAGVLRQLRRRQAHRQARPALTYRELADLAGWSHGIIGEYLSGKILPPPDRFDVLVELLGAGPAERGRLATVRDRVDDTRRVFAQAGLPGPQHPVPRQLPPDIASFAGRADALAALDAALADQARQRAVVIALIWGGPGIGKSALAAHWARRVADRFPDGQLHTAVGDGSTDAAETVRGLLESLGVPADGIPGPLDQRSALLRSLLSGRRLLIVLDDVATAEQVRLMLPGTPGNMVLVTSRTALTGLVAIENARPVPLGPLSASESRLVLARRLGDDRLRTDPTAVDRVVDACRGLPLALAAAAAFAATRPSFPLSTLADEITTHGWTALLPSTDRKPAARGANND
ncbi:hypothetical protein Q0Z83_045770 [Actinoplanes sichuanensis]|uniref:NB-ARC domain-containing protein n=1 Tax=Actinoplanes sichuanensis TaxID=512349 RepID=A0ABW4A9F6_9ACTN|nr:helix-turn-helix domain-containing protein [Actinoplanes sichuanensis]BEL06386.1 hypothetical protein Q0Z83_045770 [Actinoplanes sichuanensis]